MRDMPLRATAAACDSSHLSPAAAVPAGLSASAAVRGCSCRMQNRPVCHHRHRQDKSICPRDKTSLAGCGRLCASPRPPPAKWMRKHRRGDPATAFFVVPTRSAAQGNSAFPCQKAAALPPPCGIRGEETAEISLPPDALHRGHPRWCPPAYASIKSH